MASKLGYALLAAITAPVGGTVAGYLYAQKENEIAHTQGLPAQKSEFVSAAVGFLFGPFSGLYYGYKLAETQNNLNELRTSAPARTVYAERATGPQFDGPEQSLNQNKWRDQVSTSRTTHAEQTR